jgi:hypothetical protein
MFGFSWVAALILVGVLTLMGWLVRRALRGSVRPVRPATREDDDAGRDAGVSDRGDWATDVLGQSRAGGRRARDR